MPKLLLCTADLSGDIYGKHLVEAIRKVNKDIKFLGFGGGEMEKAGVKIEWRLVSKSTIGITQLFTQPKEWLTTLPSILQRFQKILDSKDTIGILFISSELLNLPLARLALKMREDIPRIYLNPREIWASEFRFFGEQETRHIVDTMSAIITSFTFEKEIYQDYVNKFGSTTKVIYEGHPYVDFVRPKLKKEDIRRKFSIEPGMKIIGLLPGSRKHEVQLHSPLILEAAKEILRKNKNTKFILLIASDFLQSNIMRYVRQEVILNKKGLIGSVGSADRYDLMSICDVIIAASGSCALEATCLGIPSVIIYKLPPADKRRLFVDGLIKLKTPYISIPNILAGKEIYPELIEKEVTPTRIEEEVMKILEDDKKSSQIKKSLKEIYKSKLGKPGVLDRLAQFILETTTSE